MGDRDNTIRNTVFYLCLLYFVAGCVKITMDCGEWSDFYAGLKKPDLSRVWAVYT